MKNKIYTEPTLTLCNFGECDVVMLSTGADFEVGDLLGNNGGVPQ